MANTCPHGQVRACRVRARRFWHHRGTPPIVDLPESRRYRPKEMAISSAIGPVTASAGGRVPTLDTSLRSYYDVLFAAHGPQHWWPGRTTFEIIVGAILTQNTSWSNVEIAM